MKRTRRCGRPKAHANWFWPRLPRSVARSATSGMLTLTSVSVHEGQGGLPALRSARSRVGAFGYEIWDARLVVPLRRARSAGTSARDITVNLAGISSSGPLLPGLITSTGAMPSQAGLRRRYRRGRRREASLPPPGRGSRAPAPSATGQAQAFADLVRWTSGAYRSDGEKRPVRGLPLAGRRRTAQHCRWRRTCNPRPLELAEIRIRVREWRHRLVAQRTMAIRIRSTRVSPTQVNTARIIATPHRGPELA